jgi:hypothetical protein
LRPFLLSAYEGESSLFILRASLTMPLADLEFEISESGAGQVDRAVAELKYFCPLTSCAVRLTSLIIH